MKYYVLLPSVSAVGTSLDNVQWETILRAVSARGGFRMEYGPGGGPAEITEFPGAEQADAAILAFCVDKLRSNLRYLHKGVDGPLPVHGHGGPSGTTVPEP